MKLMIISSKVGKVGDYFEPTEGINVQALIDGGFIAYEPGSTDESKKSPNIKKTPKE